MAHYLLRIENVFSMVESDSAKQAVETQAPKNGETYLVWTLRSSEPRTFTVSTESVRTITKT